MIKTAYLVKKIDYKFHLTTDLDPVNFIYTFRNYLNG
jgi:TATA-binding protein-associated factor